MVMKNLTECEILEIFILFFAKFRLMVVEIKRNLQFYEKDFYEKSVHFLNAFLLFTILSLKISLKSSIEPFTNKSFWHINLKSL